MSDWEKWRDWRSEIRTAQEMQLGIGISESERAELMALANDLPTRMEPSRRQRRKRASGYCARVLEEVVVQAEPGRLRLKLHWKGGDAAPLIRTLRCWRIHSPPASACMVDRSNPRGVRRSRFSMHAD